MAERPTFLLTQVFRCDDIQLTVSQEIDIQALQRGDVLAFEVLVIQYEKKVLNMCWYILQNKEEAEDATQDIFLTIYQSIPKFKGDAKLSTWIHRITLNKCLEHIRKAKRKKRFGIHLRIDPAFIDHTVDLNKNPEEALMEKERVKVFLEAVQQLSENQRIAYTLHHMDEFSYKEISESMNLSLSAIESLIFRAKQHLKATLNDSIKNNWI
jgi:RNA polymerase sigma-70 factor (ECF subfamily)